MMSHVATGASKHLQFRSRILTHSALRPAYVLFPLTVPLGLAPLSPRVFCLISDRLAIADALRRSRQVFGARFNLASKDHSLIADVGPVEAPVPVGPGGVFAAAWRNYVKSVFQKGHMYTLSCQPRTFLYVAENKTLAGREDRERAGEALGRKLAFVFFERAPGPGNLVRRVDKERMDMY